MKGATFKVIIEYKMNGENIWRMMDITPEEYFDLDEDESIEIDSVPIYNHAIDYIQDCLSRIMCTRITISDNNAKKRRVITTTYWNNQQNSITERIDLDNDQTDCELIIEVKISDNPPVYEIMRVIKESDVFIPIYHGFIKDMEDGSQVENKIL